MSLVDEYGTTPSARSTALTSARKPNKTVIPPPMPMPAIIGELSPSPPVSPSPAPTMRTRLSSSKVNQMLDAHRLAPPSTPPTSVQAPNPANLATATRQSQCERPKDVEHTAPTANPPVRPANNCLPQFIQMKEVASLQPQKVTSCLEQKDPLDKYSKEITKAVHDPYPGAVYAQIKQEIINEWGTMEGETLLAVPFGDDVESPDQHKETCNHVFDAVGEITQSSTYGIASPITEEELRALQAKQHNQNAGQKRKRNEEHVPGTFLIHSLSQVHFQILLQQTVWASRNITFRIICPEMTCPTFLFAIKGLRTNNVNLVKDCISETWNDETTTQFIHDRITVMDEAERDNAMRSVQLFKASMWVERLATKGQGGLQRPTFNVHANGDYINDSNAWLNIRLHLAGRSYHSSKFGHGQNLVTPNHCGLCHGADHPQGLCPFPEIDSWLSPNDTDTYHQKTDRYTRNSGRFPPSARY